MKQLSEVLSYFQSIVKDKDIPIEGLHVIMSFNNSEAALQLETAFRHNYLVVSKVTTIDKIRETHIKVGGISLSILSPMEK